MRGHNICFNGEILKIIPKLSLLLLLIWSPVYLIILDCVEIFIVSKYIDKKLLKESSGPEPLLYLL